MNEGQTLLERCLLLPADATARKVFADWLQENGEPELAESMRGERGEEHLRELQYESNRIARFPCVKFLWAVVFVIQAGHRQLAGDLSDMRAGQLLTLPEGVEVSWPQRPGFFRRLFGGRR